MELLTDVTSVRRNIFFYIIYVLIIVSVTAFFSLMILNGRFSGFATKTEYLFHRPSSIKNETLNQLINDLRKFEKTLIVNESRNSMGFKDYEWKLKKPSNTYRIIALGDSFTAGVHLPINDTWPKQLEKKLNNLNLSMKFEVYNMGKPGSYTSEELEIFKNYGLRYNPDLVILQYCNNDWEDPKIENQARELWKKYQRGTYKLPSKIEETIREVNASERSISRIIYYYVLLKYYRTTDVGKEWDKWVKPYLIKLIEITRRKNIKLIVITWDMKNHPLQKKKLTTLLRKYQIPFYDFSSDLPFYPVPSRIRLLDYHLTAYGYGIVANKLLPIILNEINNP